VWGALAALRAPKVTPSVWPAFPASSGASNGSCPPAPGGLGGPQPRDRVPVVGRFRKSWLRRKWVSHNNSLMLTRRAGLQVLLAWPEVLA